MPDTYDATTMKEIKQRAADLEANFSGYVKMCKRLDQMFHMEWDDKPTDSNMKITISPSGHNAAQGAIRLLVTADPIPSVPYDMASADGKEKSEKLETFVRATLEMSGRQRRNPVSFSAVTSAILYGRMDLSVALTDDLSKQAKGASKAAEKRMERLAMRTPLFYDVLDPKAGFPEYDSYGQSAYFRKVKMKSGEVLDTWGVEAQKILDPTKRNEDVDYCDFWDFENHIVWLDGKDGNLLAAAHGLPTLPIVSQITEGERFFEKMEQQIQPFLYAWDKSEMWKRQNLALSVLYTLIFTIGANPQYIYTGPEGTDMQVDWSVPGGLIKLAPGQQYQALNKQVIDPSLMQGLQIANDMEGETMLQKQALGQPVGGNASFSMVSLLSQSGRLPLTSHKKRGGFGLSSILEAGMLILKESGGGKKVLTSKGSALELSPADIPDDLMIDCPLEVSLPQDKLQNANIAQMVVGSKLMSKRWARENVLGEGQSDAMTKEIWTEEAEDMFAQIMQAQNLPQVQQMIQQVMSGQGGGQNPGQLPGQNPGQMPGEMPSGMQGQPAAAGAEMQGGLPQAMAGLVPAGGPMAEPGQPGPGDLAGMMGGM